MLEHDNETHGQIRLEEVGPRAPQELGAHISTSWVSWWTRSRTHQAKLTEVQSQANSEGKLLESLNTEYLLQKTLCGEFKNEFIIRHMKETAGKVTAGETWEETDKSIKKQLPTVRGEAISDR